MLFRHQLVHRQSRGEDIFFFCFFFLDFIKGKEFCTHHISETLKKASSLTDGAERVATAISSEAILDHSRDTNDWGPSRSKRNSVSSKFGRSLDDIHRDSGLTSDVMFPMQPLRSLDDSLNSTPRPSSSTMEDESSDDEVEHDEERTSGSTSIPTSNASVHLSDEEYDSERLVLGDVEAGGSWQLVKERNFDTFMAEHLKNLPDVANSPSKSVPEPILDSGFARSSLPELHATSASSSPGTSPKELPQRLHEDSLAAKLEVRKTRLEHVRNEFMRLHQAHILPETTKLRSSIWSSWFSGFNFK